MPIITVTDLNNAKIDVDHIADIATSLELTATDRNGNVKDTIAGAVYKIAGITNRGAWAALTAYATKDIVSESGTWYVCVVAHTSSALFATDVASKWRIYQGVTTGDLSASSGANLVGFVQSAAGAAATTVQEKLRQFYDLKVDFGAVGDGVANDTVAWLAFKAACVADNIKGYMPAGTYLVDAFTFGFESAGLVLEGQTYGRTGERPGVAAGPGVFGVTPTLLRLRTASATFVTIAGAYDLNISNVSLDGNGFANSILYYPGVDNNTHTHWSGSFFMRPTPTTGYVHHYAGGSGGEGCTFFQCVLRGDDFPTDSTFAAACVYMVNANAFLGEYENCVFQTATDLIFYGQGASNLTNCEFYGPIDSCVTVLNTCQSFVMMNPYNEGSTGVPFFRQVGTAGSTLDRWITIINAQVNSPGATIQLNGQQPVHIMDSFIGPSNIDMTPMATYGVMHSIVEGCSFNPTFGITGTGALTHINTRGNGILDAGVFTENASNFPQAISVEGIAFGRGRADVATNTAVGVTALDSVTTGAGNTAHGYFAGLSITSGDNNTVVGANSLDQGAGVTGDENVAVGRLVMRALTSGSGNTAIGNQAGNGITTAQNCTLIGFNANPSAITTTFEVVVGSGLTGKGTQTAFIGGTAGAYNAKNVTTWETVSDARVKTNIVPSTKGLAAIRQISVRNFNYLPQEKMPMTADGVQFVVGVDSDKTITGGIAQEMEAAGWGECVAMNSNGIRSVNIDAVIWGLVKAIQDLADEFDAYKADHP